MTAGYVQREQVRAADGTFSQEYEVFEEPERVKPTLLEGGAVPLPPEPPADKGATDMDNSTSAHTPVPSVQLKTKEIQREKPRREEPEIIPPFNGQAFIEALADYEAHRREMGKSKILHTTGRKHLYEKLELFGEHDATLALNEAVANGWIGVFQPKNGNGRNGNNGNGPQRPVLSEEARARKEADLRERMTGQRA